MSEHFTQATENVTQFCGTCMRVTEHLVSNGRLGRCREHGPGEGGWTAGEIFTEERTRAESIRKLRSQRQ